MEGTPQEEISPQTKPISPPCPKRARTEYLSENNRFDSSQLTSQDAISSPSTNDLWKMDGLIAAEHGWCYDERARSQSYEVCVTDGSSPTSSNIPSPPECKQLEEEAPVSWGVCLQNDENPGAHTPPSFVQAVTFCSAQGADTDLCHIISQQADVLESDLEREEIHFSVREAGGSPTSSRDFQASPTPRSDVEGDLFQKSNLQFCEDIIDQKSKTFIDCAEGSIPCYELVLGRDIVAEKVRFEEHNYVRAAESPPAARISQEPAKGANKVDAFSVIDPVMWREIEEVELLWNSVSAVDGEFSPLVKVCKLETTPQPCSEVGTQPDSSSDQTEPLQDQRRTPECGCHTLTEPQARSGTSNEMQDQTDNEGKSSSIKHPPAEDDGTREICDIAGHQLEEQSLSSYLAIRPSHMEMPQLESSYTESHRVEDAAGTKQNHSAEETEADHLRNLVETIKSKEEFELQHKPEGRIVTQKHGGRFKCIEGEQETEPCEDFGALSSMTAEGEEHKQELDVGGEINPAEAAGMQDESEEHVENQSKPKGDISEDVSEWVENRLALFNGEDPEQRLACFAHDQHTPDIPTLCSPPPTTDAVVPCESQNSLRSLRYFPSAFAPCSGVLGGFDTFEKIKLSPDGDDDDGTGLSAMPVLSLSKELPNNNQVEPELPVQMESQIKEKKLVDEQKEKESPKCLTGHMENGFVPSDSCWNAVPKQPGKEPNSESASDSSQFSHDETNPQSVSSAVPSDCTSASSDQSTNFNFEMKEQFGRVLQELSLFFDISRNEFSSDHRPAPPKPCAGLPESLEEPSTEVQLSGPGLECYAHTSTGSWKIRGFFRA